MNQVQQTRSVDQDFAYWHHKQPCEMVEKVLKAWGYGNKQSQNAKLYSKRIVNISNPLNPDFLKDEQNHFEHKRIVRDCVDSHASQDEQVPLVNLLDGRANDFSMKQKRDKIYVQFRQINNLIQGYQIKSNHLNSPTLKEDKQQVTDTVFLQILMDIKELFSNARSYQQLYDQIKSQMFRQDAIASLEDIKIAEAKKNEMILEASIKIQDIAECQSDVSDGLKRLSIFKLQSMLYQLDEISNSDMKYKIFLDKCVKYQNIYLSEWPQFILSSFANKTYKQELLYRRQKTNNFQEKGWIELDNGIQVYINRSGQLNEDNISLQKGRASLILESPAKDQLNATPKDFLAKIQQKYEKSLRSRQKNDAKCSLMSKFYLSEESVKLEMQEMESFLTKLNQVQKVVEQSSFSEYPKVIEQIQKIQKSQERIKLQTAGGQDHQLEDIILSKLNNQFKCNEAEMVILDLINTLKSYPDNYSIKETDGNSTKENTDHSNQDNKITNRHIREQKSNLKPILSRINPAVFLDTKKAISHKQKQISSSKKRSVSAMEYHSISGKKVKQSEEVSMRSSSNIGNKEKTSQKPNPKQSTVKTGKSLSFKSAVLKVMGIKQINNSTDDEDKFQKLAIKKYIEDSFDAFGSNNYFCEQQNEIEVQSEANQTQLDNILAEYSENDDFDDSCLLAQNQLRKSGSYTLNFAGRDNSLSQDNIKSPNDPSTPVVYLNSLKFPTSLSQDQSNNTLVKFPQEIQPRHQSLSPMHKKQSLKFAKSIKFDPSQTHYSKRYVDSSLSTKRSKDCILQQREDLSLLSRSKEQNFMTTASSKWSKTRVSFHKSSLRATRDTGFFVKDNKDSQNIEFSHQNSKSLPTSQNEKKSNKNGDSHWGQSLNGLNEKNSKNVTMRTTNYSEKEDNQSNADIFPIKVSKQKQQFIVPHNQRNMSSPSAMQTPLNIKDRKSLTLNKDIDQIMKENIPQIDKQVDILDEEDINSQNRQQLIAKILNSKRPKYIKLGNSGCAVRSTTEQIKEKEKNIQYIQNKSQYEEVVKNRAKFAYHLTKLGKELDMSDIDTLSGPPKKNNMKISTIQTDFNDKMIGKIIKTNKY